MDYFIEYWNGQMGRSDLSPVYERIKKYELFVGYTYTWQLEAGKQGLAVPQEHDTRPRRSMQPAILKGRSVEKP